MTRPNDDLFRPWDEDDDAYEELANAEWDDSAGKQSDNQIQFKKDIEAAGLRVEFYFGRFYYKGWATRTKGGIDGLQEAIRATEVMVQWDTLGIDGNIVYPQH